MSVSDQVKDPKAGVLPMIKSVVNIRMIGRIIKQFFLSSPAQYYEDLGYDVIEGKGSIDSASVSGPIWQNCGYWEGVSSYNEACEKLARKVGEAAELNRSTLTLDVGFGFGEQGIFWVRNFDVCKIIGVNISKFQVEFAKKRAQTQGLVDRLEYKLGDAVHLPLDDAAVDRVIAMQSAFQFNTREDFFKEAARVMKPNGIIVLADMILQEGHKRQFKLWSWFTRRRVGWPDKNVYDTKEYKRILERTGFENIDITVITNKVFPGMSQYIKRRYRGKRSEDIFIDAEKAESSGEGKSLWRFHYGVDEYVIVKATKKDPSND
jgi:microcystin synthetase protein McyJ